MIHKLFVKKFTAVDATVLTIQPVCTKLATFIIAFLSQILDYKHCVFLLNLT